LNGVFIRVMLSDLSYFFRTKWLMATLISLSASNLLVLGLIYNNLTEFNYLSFFAPGVIMMSVLSSSFDVGRRIHLGLTEGVTQYFLSLPISLRGLALAYMVSSGLGGVIYGGIMLLISSLFLQGLRNIEVLIVLPFLFLISTALGGITGLILILSKSGHRYWVYVDILELIFVGFSTVFYPYSIIQIYLPKPIAHFSYYNPLSLSSDILRGIEFYGVIDLGKILYLSLDSIFLIFIGFFLFNYIFSKVHEEGKLI